MDERIQQETIKNRFLGALQPESLARLRPHLELVELLRRQVIYSPGEEANAVYFIDRGYVSLVKSMRDGRLVEVGGVGVEGAVCLSGLLGLRQTVLEALVQIPGCAWRIKSAALREEAARDPALIDLIRRYAAISLGQLAQNSACNRLHSLDQRCCRWLLTAQESSGGDTFQLTHEVLALMLGVQRPGVSITARALQDAGLIQYQNGRVTVTDRSGLEAGACECYATMNAQFADLFKPA